MELARRHDDEVPLVQVARERCEEELVEPPARPLEERGGRLQAGSGAAVKRQTPECELQGGPLGCRELRPEPRYRSSKRLPSPDHGVELAVVLDELDQDSFADRLPQVGGLRESGRLGEITVGASAALADRRLDPSLLLDQRLRILPLERHPLKAGDGVPQACQQPGQPLVASGASPAGAAAHQRATVPTNAARLDRSLRLERELQTEIGELGDGRRGPHAQLGRAERRPVLVGDFEPGPERRHCAGAVASGETVQSLAVPDTHALRGRTRTCPDVDAGEQRPGRRRIAGPKRRASSQQAAFDARQEPSRFLEKICERRRPPPRCGPGSLPAAHLAWASTNRARAAHRGRP